MNWAKNDILYLSFSNMLSYKSYNDKNDKEYKTEIFNTGLYRSDNDSALVNSSYVWFLSIDPIMKYPASDSLAMQLLRKKESINSLTRTFDNLIKNEKYYTAAVETIRLSIYNK